MTFELVRWGWPNTAAILALAMMPFLTLATVASQPPDAVAVQWVEPAAACLSAAECPTVVAAGAAAVAVME